ncbi:MAG: hypothetical protein K0Q87_5157, partial [Neobacillus sp.]|nr:hypothetical protein [Neobacillus sp.]
IFPLKEQVVKRQTVPFGILLLNGGSTIIIKREESGKYDSNKEQF